MTQMKEKKEMKYRKIKETLSNIFHEKQNIRLIDMPKRGKEIIAENFPDLKEE